MKITLVRSMARSAVFELVNSGCYRAPAPYTVSLDGATVCEGDTNVFSLYSLEPGRSYTLAVTLDGVTDTLDFTTAEESFFVDASRYGLVADGVTDNTAKLQAALSTCPAGGTVYVPAGTYRTQSLFLQSSTTFLAPLVKNRRGRQAILFFFGFWYQSPFWALASIVPSPVIVTFSALMTLIRPAKLSSGLPSHRPR